MKKKTLDDDESKGREDSPSGRARAEDMEALKAQGEEIVYRRMTRQDMISPTEYGNLFGFGYERGSLVEKLVADGYLLGIECRGQIYMPSWQVHIMRDVQTLIAVIKNHREVFFLLDVARESFNGRTGRAALEQGESPALLVNAYYHD